MAGDSVHHEAGAPKGTLELAYCMFVFIIVCRHTDSCTMEALLDNRLTNSLMQIIVYSKSFRCKVTIVTRFGGLAIINLA